LVCCRASTSTVFPYTTLFRSNGQRAVAAEVVALPFRDASFDLVGSVIFMHHLAPDQVIQSVNEALRVCRTAVIINDLLRHPIHLDRKSTRLNSSHQIISYAVF